ncbi:uncharacterized protein LAESUDRAFT_646202 [Laetiporus sulphureus 93-53]|uniref:P/Homo B domain-containing protein n=1 Tax=Laetiporus sulphureus 93-53 TaxID=1314785 RepID=A0A165FYY8_9APHY|nr:uncharacterized protein LAESUDRAFT_646202 [Laetiporus sulphureus 93-53]KZT09596.1 hypothetical protein LAESUDRAFT_646202 [Laetiporus sulphureus 93-53]
MRLPLTLILVLLAFDSAFASPAKRHYSTHDYYVLEHTPLAGASLADCARALGVEVVEQAGELRNHWLVRTPKPTSNLRKRRADPVLEAFRDLRTRAQSSHLAAREEDALHSRRIVSSVKHISPQVLRQRVKRAPPPIRPPDEEQDIESSAVIAARMGITDPEFGRQWHLINDAHPHHMMNVTGLWDMGYTGTGVITALVDDGLDYTSEDLAANFYAAGSYDFNDHEDLPTPKLFDDHHGTRCAGQIAAVKNDVCGVGIAYDSQVAGIRILSGPISDVDEASSLNYDYQNTSIYSCSWGPPDDGKSMEGPGYLIKKAIVNGVQNGRQGKGSVFVFASGNGGRSADQCNFDGYTNSIFSVTVGAIDFRGLHPDYSEACAANMIVAYSSGSGNQITTTDRGQNKCSHSHGGTSAAAPNAAGVFALALQARPDLTWRDIQHLCVKTATKVNPDDPDWETTASGNRFSYKYGYGAINGVEFVRAAQTWQVVKPQVFLDLPTMQVANGTMDLFQSTNGGELIVPGGVSSTINVDQSMLDGSNFGALEHITIKVWITHSRRGDVEVELVSPNGVKSVLAGRRFADAAKTGYPGWTFMTIKHWDENPVGAWTLTVFDQNKEDESGNFLGWTMTLWGSAQDETQPIKVYDVPVIDDILPPVVDESTDNSTSTIATPSPAKTIPKPTAHLPGDHGDSEGEASKPAFSGSSGSQQDGTKPEDDAVEASASATSTPTADEGWFFGLSRLLSNQVWFFVAIGAVVIFGLSAGLFFWRRAVRRRRANYRSLPESDDVAMRSIGRTSGGGQRTKELYDAFGEVSDDEDADEETHLHPQGHSPSVNLHSGFLDDEPSTGGMTPAHYRDVPENVTLKEKPALEHSQERSDSRASGSGSTSADGSWEHASETR